MGMSVPATERISQQRRTIYTYPYARDVRTKLPTTVQYSQQNKYLAPRSFLYQPTTNQPRTTTRKTAWTATTTTTLNNNNNHHKNGKQDFASSHRSNKLDQNRTEPNRTNDNQPWHCVKPDDFFLIRRRIVDKTTQHETSTEN